MTSGQFSSIPLDKIRVERDRRQRREVTNVDELAESMARIGQINPITVTRDLILVAGERRFTAACKLKWTHVNVQFTDELTTSELHAIELEENIKRVDLTWQDQVRALDEYHNLRKADRPDWTQADTARAIGLTQNTVSEQLSVARNLTDPRIAEAPKYSVAKNIVKRNEERKDEQAIVSLRQAIGAPADTPEEKAPPTIINASFNEWAPNYEGPRFNLIHCDFPYGIEADSFNQGGAAAHGGYADDEGTYWELCRTLAGNLDRLATPSAHLMFWFSMKFYQPTLEFFARETDFIIDPFPLIWMKSDNVGILPDPQRGPRRIYETALLGRRGDRKVVQAVANAVHHPTVRDRHMSEKPEGMLRQFFRMLVDGNSLVLDPTCGSGSAIRAAESLGAKHTLGLELNPEFAERAQLALERSRLERKNGEAVQP